MAAKHDSTRADTGSALVLSLFFTIVVTGLITVGAMVMVANRERTETNFRLYGQATQAARAGLTEALTWFRRQASQPVVDFEPRMEPLANPPVLDTDDPDIGLVREFDVHGQIRGRYEVWREWAGDPDPVRLAWRQQVQARDVSLERTLRMPGTAWLLRSVGYVYRNVDPSKRYDERPNHVLAKIMLETELFRLRLAPPGQSAVCVGDGNDCHINTMGRIVGGANGAGIYYPAASGTPTVGPEVDNRVSGTPGLAQTTSYDDSIEGVFGLSELEFRAIATHIISNPTNFPVPVQDHSIVFVDCDMTFDATTPLKGHGIVVISGSCFIAQDSNSDFSGILYVDGGFTMRDPATIRGAVVVTGNMTVQGMPDYAEIIYDESALNSLRQEIGQYRRSGAIRPVISRY